MLEYFWYILASVLAGVGTGLVGLSAATVMVPILIVLCPSFAGETGAYQATAVALASDILGSAVTTATYIRHKNIDLRRGWIMLACIIGMCTVGSFAAWKAGNVVLTLLGGALILLHYWDFVAASPLLLSTLRCFGEYLLFIVPAALMLLLFHFTAHIPKVVFRKLLHLPAFCSAAVVVWRADNWQAACLTLALFAAVVYPALCLCERWQGYGGLFVEKKTGEVKTSLLLLFLSDAALVALCWGGFGLPGVAVTAILMWGAGDGAAALAGHRFGRHHVKLPLVDPKKTWEGSGAMFAVSASWRMRLSSHSSNRPDPAFRMPTAFLMSLPAAESLFCCFSRAARCSFSLPISSVICLNSPACFMKPPFWDSANSAWNSLSSSPNRWSIPATLMDPPGRETSVVRRVFSICPTSTSRWLMTALMAASMAACRGSSRSVGESWQYFLP